MAWCYTFGIRVGDGDCMDPMLVVEGESRCACTSCETSCLGKFPGCQTRVFAPGGRLLQIRALPQELIPGESNVPVDSRSSGNGSLARLTPPLTTLDVTAPTGQEPAGLPPSLKYLLRRFEEIESRLALLESRPGPAPPPAAENETDAFPDSWYAS